MTGWADDPVGALEQLGAQWSPDIDAYGRGELDISQVRCLRCQSAPCTCTTCTATQENKYHVATGRPQFETCGMTVDPSIGQCPRGH